MDDITRNVDDVDRKLWMVALGDIRLYFNLDKTFGEPVVSTHTIASWKARHPLTSALITRQLLASSYSIAFGSDSWSWCGIFPVWILIVVATTVKIQKCCCDDNAKNEQDDNDFDYRKTFF